MSRKGLALIVSAAMTTSASNLIAREGATERWASRYPRAGQSVIWRIC
jgi:hypothetical protein